MLTSKLYCIDRCLFPLFLFPCSDQCYDWPGWNPGGSEQHGLSQCPLAVSPETEVQPRQQPQQPGADPVPLPGRREGPSSCRHLKFSWVWEYGVGSRLQHPLQQVQPRRGRGGGAGAGMTLWEAGTWGKTRNIGSNIALTCTKQDSLVKYNLAISGFLILFIYFLL